VRNRAEGQGEQEETWIDYCRSARIDAQAVAGKLTDRRGAQPRHPGTEVCKITERPMSALLDDTPSTGRADSRNAAQIFQAGLIDFNLADWRRWGLRLAGGAESLDPGWGHQEKGEEAPPHRQATPLRDEETGLHTHSPALT